jgi:hypothetical protein
MHKGKVALKEVRHFVLTQDGRNETKQAIRAKACVPVTFMQ